MQQYFAINKNLELKKSDYHHIINVMRMKENDKVRIVYDGILYNCLISKISNLVKFDVINKQILKESNVSITIAFSLIKEQKLDYLLQKCTEVGASIFIPLVTERTVVKIDQKKELKKLERWKAICKEAAEQSYRYNIPEIVSIKRFNDLVNEEYDLKLVCSLNKNTKNLKKVLQNTKKCAKILLVVGPEGGFTIEEENYLIDNNFISVSLGDNVLRAETAPVTAISMINYEFMR